MSQSALNARQTNYEKITLLALFGVLIFSCIFLIGKINDNRNRNGNYAEATQLGGADYTLQDTSDFDRRFSDEREKATKVFENLPERTFVSESRVSCINCGKPIPYAALSCPFCLKDQPEIIDAETVDTDGDGITDKQELALGLDAQNPGDAHGDLDGDGFSNVEEVLAGTNPLDPTSMPDPIVKLRVLGIKPIPFYLRFVSESEFGDGTLRFQLNMQTQSAPTLFVKLGDTVQGYKIENYDPKAQKGPTLTLRRLADGRIVNLVRGKPVTENEMAIKFVFLIDRTSLPVKRLNDTFELRGKTYKVIDIQGSNVIIEDAATKKTIAVPKLTPEERAGSAAPAPAPAAGVVLPAVDEGSFF